MPYPALVQAEKKLVNVPAWALPHPDDRFIFFHAPLEVEGVIEEGFILKGGCFLDLPDRHVAFELRVNEGSRKRSFALARFEWRSTTGGHSNQRREQIAIAGRRVGETHYHPFELNWVAAERRMRLKDLPGAVAVAEDIQTFEELTAHVGNLFRISNMKLVLRPHWVQDLFANV